jgi:hypothetical protein
MPGLRRSIVFESFGLIGEVGTEDAELFERIPAMLPPGWRPSSAASAVHFGVTRNGEVTLDGEVVQRTASGPDAALIRLGSVIRHHLAEHAEEHTFIHAGVVRPRGAEGAILIPGASFSGKTTLVAELVRAGATYYSDEFAVTGPDGLVHPFAKPLSVRRNRSQELGSQLAVDARQIATEPVRVALIVITSYRAGADWNPTVGTSGEGALALLEHTVPTRTRPQAALATVSALARGALVLSGVRGEARATAAALLESQT